MRSAGHSIPEAIMRNVTIGRMAGLLVLAHERIVQTPYVGSLPTKYYQASFPGGHCLLGSLVIDAQPRTEALTWN